MTLTATPPDTGIGSIRIGTICAYDPDLGAPVRTVAVAAWTTNSVEHISWIPSPTANDVRHIIDDVADLPGWLDIHLEPTAALAVELVDHMDAGQDPTGIVEDLVDEIITTGWW